MKDKTYTPVDNRRWRWARIGREEEGTSSFRAELAALLMLLREAPADDTRVARIWTHVGETDSESERVRLTVERPRQTDRQTAGRARERDDKEKVSNGCYDRLHQASVI